MLSRAADGSLEHTDTIPTGGALALVTGSAATLQGAACWVAVTPNGKFAFTGNAAGSITSFAIGADGALTRVDADGLSAAAPRPNDLATSRSGRYLYAINPRDGVVTAYEIGEDGSLAPIAGAALPDAGNAGIAAR